MSEVEIFPTRHGEKSEDAFAEIVRRYIHLVHSVARRRLGNDALAEQAAQLVFIRLARSRPRFPTEAALISWLHRTATNLATDFLRSELRRRKREQEAIQMHQSDENLEEVACALDREIDRLSNGEREVILLRYFGKLRMTEIGATLGISEDAAKMRVSRAVETLRQRLTRAGVACGSAALLGFLTAHAVSPAPATLAARIISVKTNVGVASLKPLLKFALAGVITTAIVLGLITIPSLWNRAEPTVSVPSTSPLQTQTPAQFGTASNNPQPRGFLTIQLVNAETGAAVADALVLQNLDEANIPPQQNRFASDSNGEVKIPSHATGTLSMTQSSRHRGGICAEVHHMGQVGSSKSRPDQSVELNADGAEHEIRLTLMVLAPPQIARSTILIFPVPGFALR